MHLLIQIESLDGTILWPFLSDWSLWW